MSEITCAKLRRNLASVLERVVNHHEIVIVRRDGATSVALVPADELSGLMETVHLLRSPNNASAC